MAEITVTKLMENQLMEFKVVVKEGDYQSEHMVSLNKADYQRSTNGDIKPEVLIEEAFKFLLKQEPKEDILKKFDFSLIGRYFPHFNKQISKQLKKI